MALGTALTAATTISTTAAVHNMNFNGDGIALVDVMNTNQSVFYICLMSYNDYANVAPIQDGDHSQILIRFGEYAYTSSDPTLEITTTDGGTVNITSTIAGNDDDATLGNVTFDGSVSWDTIRGDIDTVGTYRNDSLSSIALAIYTIKLSGRGGAVITDNRRTYLAFDGAVLNPAKTVSAVRLKIYADNRGHTNDDFGKIIAVQSTALAGSTADYGNCFAAVVVGADNATFFGSNF